MTYDGRRGTNGIVDLGKERMLRLDPSVARIERYWRDIRGNRLVPTRTDIDPRGLSGVLSRAFVLERIATGLARFRIAGSHMTDLMGLDVKGMPLSTIFLPDSRQTLADAIESAFDDPSIIRLRLSAETGFGKAPLNGDMVLLPLRSDLGEVSRILGGLYMQGDMGRAPRRLRIELQSREGLTGLGHADADTPASQKEQKRPIDTDAFTSRPREPSFLRLVVDNRQ